MSAQDVMEAALRLSPEERESVGEALLESVGQGWNAFDMPKDFLEKRLDEMKRDATKRVALDEVFPELRPECRCNCSSEPQARLLEKENFR